MNALLIPTLADGTADLAALFGDHVTVPHQEQPPVPSVNRPVFQRTGDGAKYQWVWPTTWAPTALDAKRGAELTAALKRMSVARVASELALRRGAVPAGMEHDKQGMVVILANIIDAPVVDPVAERGADTTRIRQLSEVKADPTGIQRDADQLTRAAKYQAAGRAGSDGRKARLTQMAADQGVAPGAVAKKLSDPEVRLLRYMHDLGWSNAKISKAFNERIKTNMVWYVWTGRSYKNVSAAGERAPMPAGY